MTNWPDIAALELLVAVADEGSLSAGARSVGMAQANASRSMSRLERRLGVTLLARSTTGSSLTPSGIIVVEWARDVLDASRRLMEGTAGLSDAPSSVITVAASQTIAEHLLPQWLARIRREDSTPVRVVVTNSADVIAQVRAGRVTLGFVEGPRPPGDIHSIVVAHDDLVAVVAPDHGWTRRRNPLPIAELGATPLVTREEGSGTRVTLDNALGEAGPATSALELRSNAAVMVAVESGAAPAVLSRLVVRDAIARGDLVEVEVDGLSARRALRTVWTGPRQLSGVAADLVTAASTRKPR